MYAIPSLGYPFGGDQGTFFYIGREWLDGLLPFKDAFDQKPPGIHMIYALSVFLFGARQTSIRILEIIAVLVLGRLITYAVTRDRPKCNGEAGIITLLLSAWYFTCLNYWDTAQVEIWEALALVCSYIAAKKIKNLRLAGFVSGALTGIAVLFKFPAAVVALVPATVAGWRCWQKFESDRGKRLLTTVFVIGLYLTGVLFVLGIVILYFWAYGGLEALIDSLISFNYDYVTHISTDFNLAKWWCYSFWLKHSRLLFPFLLLLWFSGIRSALKRKSGAVVNGALTGLALAVLSVASVFVQQKFYAYHWGVAIPFFVLSAGYGIADLIQRHRKLIFTGTLAVVLLSFVMAPAWKLNQQGTYMSYTCLFWKYVSGNCTRDDFLSPFHNPFGLCYAEQEKIGEVIKMRAKPGETLMVKSYDTPVYAVSGLRCPSRFFWDLPHLWDPALNWKKKHFSEHEIQCRKNPARFAVVPLKNERDFRELLENGYRITDYFGNSVLLEHSLP